MQKAGLRTTIGALGAALFTILWLNNAFAASVAPNPNGVGNLVFLPTNEDVDFLSLTSTSDPVGWNFALYMFDDLTDISTFNPNTTDYLNPVDDTGLLEIVFPSQVSFSGLTATGSALPTDTLALAGDSRFSLALFNINADTWIEATTAVSAGPALPDAQFVSFSWLNPTIGDPGLAMETVAFAIDLKVVTPIPLPGAVWLLATGIALLGAVRVRDQQRR